MNKAICILLLALTAPAIQAATPEELMLGYEQEARRQDPAAKGSSAQRGEAFFRAERATEQGKASCATCHGADPRQPGKTRAGKEIGPLAPAANSQRLRDPAHVEKWFGRNCRDVVGRACSAAEKGDFIAWLVSLR